jgi:hypothetical protein
MFRGAILSLAIFLLIPHQSLAEKAEWIQLDSSNSEQSRIFKQLVLAYAQKQNIFQFQQRTLPLDQFKAELIGLKNHGKQPIFIQCNLSDYAALLNDPAMNSLLSELGIELTNGRLISFPFYIFGYPEPSQSLEKKISKLNSVQIAYLTLPAEELDGIEEADLLAMFSEILDKPKSSIRIFQERGAYTAARGLFDGHYNLVGFYEDEPSVMNEELQMNLLSELHTKAPAIFPLDRSRFSFQLYEISARLKYIVFPSSRKPSEEMAAVVQENINDLPLILSNIRFNQPEMVPRFSQTLSDIYFLMVQEITKLNFSNPSIRRRIQHLYLLNAYLNSSTDKLKGLGFLSYLLLMKDRKWSDPREKDAYDEKCALLQKELHLDRISASTILNWLEIRVPKMEKRELFTDDVSSLYQRALKKMEEGLAESDRPKRMQSFQDAQRFLIAALLQSEQPRSIQASRGLWSVADYDPYYQLARLMLYMKQEKAGL